MLDTRLHRQQLQDIDQEGLWYGGHFLLVGVVESIVLGDFDFQLRFQVLVDSSPFFSVLNDRFADFSTEFNTYFY